MFGILIAVAGLVLFHTALAITLRANPRSRVPFWRNPVTIPTGSVAMRAIGAGFIVLGVVLLGVNAWWAPFVIVLAGPVVALIAIAIHNRSVAAAA